MAPALLLPAIAIPVLAGCGAPEHRQSGFPSRPAVYRTEASALARWPWTGARIEELHDGVRRWSFSSAEERTDLQLFRFDFAANPGLRLELFDQDEDDDRPFDNRTHFWKRGVGTIVRHLNAGGTGTVVAAWNGLFFGYNRQGPDGLAEHVAPVVLNGKVHYNTGNHRWTFGVRERGGVPTFKVFHLPGRAVMEREFDFAAGAAQCLIYHGKPLRLQPPPGPGEEPLKPPVPSTPDEAGHIPFVDHMRTSRVSLGWSRDSRTLYLLFVRAQGTETQNALAFKYGDSACGGWNLADIQRFWEAVGVWGAINSDGGGPTQLAYLQDGGGYMLYPAQWDAGNLHFPMAPETGRLPQGGSLMYFYVRDTARK